VVARTTSAAAAFPLSGRPEDGAAGARLAELFAAHGAGLLGLCRMLLRDPAEAEDAVQQTFLAAYTNLLNGGDPRHPAAWLATIARNECRGRIEQRTRTPLRAVEAEPESLLPDPVAAAAANADLAALWRAIGELPRRQRKAILLREFSGLSYGELAAALGVSEPTVESLLFRARRELRARLRPVSESAACMAPLAAIREALARAIGGMPDTSAGALAGVASTTPIVAKLAAGAAVVAVAGGTVAVVDRHSGDGSPAPARAGAMRARPVARPVAMVPARSVHTPAATRSRTHGAARKTVATARRRVPVASAPARATPTTSGQSTPVDPVTAVVSPPLVESVPAAEPAPAASETTRESSSDDSSGSAAGSSDDGQTVTSDDGSTSSGPGDGGEGSSEGPGSGSSGSGSESEGSSASSGDGGSGSTETTEVEADGGGGNSGPGRGGSESSGKGSGSSGSGSSGSDD
jgi:RNA polymerase sigma factor (sigma-70 family)